MTPAALLRSAALAVGHPWPEGVPRIVGLRHPSDTAGAWDDRFALVQGDRVDLLVGTTDPGATAPSRTDGTATIVPDSYPGLWRYSTSGRDYAHLDHVGPGIPCRRSDPSRGLLPRSGPLSPALAYGIEFHHGGDTPGPVGNFSRGCQVVLYRVDLAFVLSVVGRGPVDYLLADCGERPELLPLLSLPVRTLARPVLRRGSRGEAVRELQLLLGGVVVDGDFGPATERVVEAYQRRSGLVADGVVGPATWAALRG